MKSIVPMTSSPAPELLSLLKTIFGPFEASVSVLTRVNTSELSPTDKVAVVPVIAPAKVTPVVPVGIEITSASASFLIVTSLVLP